MSVFAHQATGLPDDLLNTRDLPDTVTTLQVWGHCSMCTSPVSCLVGLLFSFPDEELEPGWHWWSWATGRQTPRPVPHISSPHPAPKMSDIHICSGKEGKGDLAKSKRAGLDSHSWLTAGGTDTPEPVPQAAALFPQTSITAGSGATKGCLFKILRRFDARIPFLQIWVKE